MKNNAQLAKKTFASMNNSNLNLLNLDKGKIKVIVQMESPIKRILILKDS